MLHKITSDQRRKCTPCVWRDKELTTISRCTRAKCIYDKEVKPMNNNCMINGTSYELILSTSKQYPKLNNVDSYCDTTYKQIIVRQPSDLNITEVNKWWLSDRLNPIVKREFIKASEYEGKHKHGYMYKIGRQNGKPPRICNA